MIGGWFDGAAAAAAAARADASGSVVRLVNVRSAGMLAAELAADP